MLSVYRFPESCEYLVKSLSEDSGNQKSMILLEKTFPPAVDYLKEKIKFNMSSREKFSWTEIAEAYRQIHALSDGISMLPELYYRKEKRIINIEPVYFRDRSREADGYAAREQYNAGLQSAESRSKESLKAAALYMEKALYFQPDYKDADDRREVFGNLASDRIIILFEEPEQDLKADSNFTDILFDKIWNALARIAGKKRFLSIIASEQSRLAVGNAEYSPAGYPTSDFLLKTRESTGADFVFVYKIKSIKYKKPETEYNKITREFGVELPPDHPEYALYADHIKIFRGTLFFMLRKTSIKLETAYKMINIRNYELENSDRFEVNLTDQEFWIDHYGDIEVLRLEEYPLLGRKRHKDKTYNEMLSEAAEKLVSEMSGFFMNRFE